MLQERLSRHARQGRGSSQCGQQSRLTLRVSDDSCGAPAFGQLDLLQEPGNQGHDHCALSVDRRPRSARFPYMSRN